MAECYLVTNYDLCLEHLSEVSEGGLDEVAHGDKMAALRKLQPTVKQALNCANVHRAYAALHDIKFDFRRSLGCGARRFLYVPAHVSWSAAHGPFQDQDR